MFKGDSTKEEMDSHLRQDTYHRGTESMYRSITLQKAIDCCREAHKTTFRNKKGSEYRAVEEEKGRIIS